MQKAIEEIVNDIRKDGAYLLDCEVQDVLNLCDRKMEVAKIENKEEYLPLLFEDEIRNYLFRRFVNLKSLIMMCEEGNKDVPDLQAISV